MGAVALVVALMGVWVWSNLNPDAPLIDLADRARLTVLPLPTDISLGQESLSLEDGLAVKLIGHTEPRLERAVARMRSRLPASARRDGEAVLEIDVGVAVDEADPLWADESYALDITPEGARLRAATPLGAIHAMQTFLQLVQTDGDGARVPIARIRDAPRFRWRGLMIDPCRHWIPKAAILRNIDAMEAAKMNVLHLHLTEDQAFRVESKVHPRLHEVGSGGSYYTQDELREIVAYARDRGIRVIPEFDLPGHSRSWLEAYPELAIDPGRGTVWEKSNVYGIHPVALDPTRDEVYQFLDDFLGEMAGIFPDPYVHIGGDEVASELWDASPGVQAYAKEQGFADHRALQAHFNARLHGILAKHGKQMMGWQEILDDSLPKDVMVQAWLGPVADSVNAGYDTILSTGYYLDHKLPAGTHYEVDPLGVPEPIEIPTEGTWRSWTIELETRMGPMEGTLVLWGDGDRQAGVSSVQGRVVVLDDVQFDDDSLSATVDSPVGRATFEAKFEGDRIEGEFGTLVFTAALRGTRQGGDDVDGTTPPELQKVAQIPPEARYRVHGGEAAMWTEVVTAETIDSRIWPTTGAIAERLWSPAESANDVEDMYRRLDVFSERLETLGLTHESYREALLVDMVGGPPPPALRTLVSALEEVKHYERHRGWGEGQELLTTTTPLDRIADAAAAESRFARRFSSDVDALLAGDDSRRAGVRATLVLLRDQHHQLREIFETSERVAAVEPQSRAIAQSAVVGLLALEALERGEALDPSAKAGRQERMAGLDLRPDGAYVAVGPALRRLIEAAEQPVNEKDT